MTEKERFEVLRERKLSTINIHLTSSCNYTCSMCPFHGEGYSGNYFSERPALKKEMCLADFEYVLNEAKKNGIETVDLTPNGEFFLYKEWREVLRKIRDAGCKAMVTTNGGVLDESMIKEACALGLSHVAVSIDTVEYERYKEVREPASEKAYKRAIHTPILFKKYGGEKVYVQVQVTEQPNYPEDVKKVLDFYAPYKLNQLSVNKMFTTSDQVISHYGVERKTAYSHGTCKSYGEPIVMPDGTVLPCCGAFYFYPQLNGVPNIKVDNLHTAVKKLDALYEYDELFKSYCQKCALYDIGNSKEEAFIYKHYFGLKESVRTRYFPIPFNLGYLPNAFILWLYKKQMISKLRGLLKGKL